jgi:hypothetical protein
MLIYLDVFLPAHLKFRGGGVECIPVQYLERAVTPLAGDLGLVLALELVPCCCPRDICASGSDIDSSADST